MYFEGDNDGPKRIRRHVVTTAEQIQAFFVRFKHLDETLYFYGCSLLGVHEFILQRSPSVHKVCLSLRAGYSTFHILCLAQFDVYDGELRPVTKTLNLYATLRSRPQNLLCRHFYRMVRHL